MSFNKKISAIILAAGMSTRMGEINKLLHPYKSKPLILHIVENAIASNIENIIVVTGHQQKKVNELIGKRCGTIFNAEYKSGMAASIRAGIYGLQGESAVMVLPGDMPFITSSSINKIIKTFLNHVDNKKIIVASNEKKFGHPVLFGAEYFGELKLLSGEKGGRQIINNNKQNVVQENIGKSAITDFDTLDCFQS